MLEKGLKFTPTPTGAPERLKCDVIDFCRKLRLSEEFYKEDDSAEEEDERPLVRNKSSYRGKKGRDQVLDTYINFLENSPMDKKEKQNFNLKTHEKWTLAKLKARTDIVIKQADKGGAVVIMDRDYYKDKVGSMLLDRTHYQDVDSNEDKKVSDKISRFIDKYKHELKTQEIKYLTKHDWRTSNFYGLPKIHKSKEIKTEVEKVNSTYIHLEHPTDLTFRPIVGGPECPTQRLSNLLDIILKPLCQKVTSNVKDTMDFLNKLEKDVPSECIIITLDVSDLYGSIPHYLGKEAIEYWVTQYPDLLCRHFSKEFIMDALELILENNVMKFDEKYYKQCQGTAMGTKCAPTYATLVMGYLEIGLYEKIETEYGAEIRNYFESHYKRFLDDCFILWPFGEPQKLIDIIDNLNPGITFTSEHSNKNCPFLDVMVIKEGRSIKTDLYSKPTDAKRYVHFRSAHPSHTKRNIPYNLARRISMIVENPQMRTKHFQELAKNLGECGYPKKLVQDSITKFKSVESKELRTLKIRQKKDLIVFVTDFNPNNPNFIDTIKHSIPMLNASDKMKKVMSNKTIIHSQRQPKNLKLLLTKSNFESSQPINQNKPKKVVKCGKGRCTKLCNMLIEGDNFQMLNGKTLYPNTLLDCDSKFVIYCLKCEGCGENYMGSTVSLRDRMSTHGSCTENSNKEGALEANKHFFTCANGLEVKFKVFPFKHIFSKSEKILRIEEEKYIKKFNPKLNRL